ncbi:MAG: radical SAM protein [Myxococcota bacterium]|nr:radical SAM protein [Myxococcota bacterium]
MARKRRYARGIEQRILSEEVGTIRKEAASVVAIGYPAPYGVGVSSLGFQTVYRLLNQIPGLSCTRFFLPPDSEVRPPLRSLETGYPVAQARAIAFSISCETELMGIVTLLKGAHLSPLAVDRGPQDPPVFIGGPLTYLDPKLVSPLADCVIVGEAETAIAPLGAAIVGNRSKQDLLAAVAAHCPVAWIPAETPSPPAFCPATAQALPALAATWSPLAELKGLFLVEATRGCKRGCAFCVMSGRSHHAMPFRPVPIDRILAAIPDQAPGVGLVGAAVTDHPEIEPLVAAIVASGRRVSLSSIRADCLTPSLAELLVRGGLRTLTLAADGCTDALRRAMHKGLTDGDLVRATEIARAAGVKGIKVYTMVGLPGESDDDIQRFADLTVNMSRHLRIAIAAQAFVPKPGTPLANADMATENVLRRRLNLLKRQVRGRARLISTSPRWSWIDWQLAHAGKQAARIAMEAQHHGGGYAAWRRAISASLQRKTAISGTKM